MDDRMAVIIEKLADKLGVATEYLWSALLRQAPIDGVADLMLLALFWFCAFGWWKLVVRKTTKREVKNDYGTRVQSEWENEGAFFAWIGVFVAFFVAAIVTCVTVSTVFAAFFNPAYWALRKFM